MKGGHLRPLWRCPRCRRRFVTRNLSHSCGGWRLAPHFRGKGPRARALFDAFLAAVRRSGPVTVDPKKTAIAVMARMRFAGVQVRREFLRCEFVLVRQIRSPRFVRVEALLPRYWVFHFEIRDPADLDREALGWLAEAAAVGRQEHVLTPAGRARLSGGR